MPALSPARLVVLLSVGLALYFGVTTAGNAIERYKLDRERDDLQEEIAVYQGQYQQLQQLTSYLKSDEYIEMVARTELGLVKPGEPGIIVTSPEKTAFPGDTGGKTRWWQQLLSP